MNRNTQVGETFGAAAILAWINIDPFQVDFVAHIHLIGETRIDLLLPMKDTATIAIHEHTNVPGVGPEGPIAGGRCPARIIVIEYDRSLGAFHIRNSRIRKDDLVLCGFISLLQWWCRVD